MAGTFDGIANGGDFTADGARGCCADGEAFAFCVVGGGLGVVDGL